MDSGLWSQVGTNFDPDEETRNFGTRHALEAEGKLFDVFTYATVEPKVTITYFFVSVNYFLQVSAMLIKVFSQHFSSARWSVKFIFLTEPSIFVRLVFLQLKCLLV